VTAHRRRHNRTLASRARLPRWATRTRVRILAAFVVVAGLVGGVLTAAAAVQGPGHGSASQAGLAAADSGTAQTAASSHAEAASTEPTASTWWTFHGSPSLNGISPDTSISTANASTLGLKWMAPTMAPMLSSPVIGHISSPSETLTFIGNNSGYVEAFNVANGSMVWSDNFGYPIYGTPTFYNGALWVGTFISGHMYKINAADGHLECTVTPSAGSDLASPTVATPPGGKPTVYLGLQDNGIVSAPEIAINEATCATEWSKVPWPAGGSGSWNPASYGVDAKGVPLVFAGTGDPDSSAYAVNADTGATVWKNQSLNPSYADVGAGLTVSAPGNNGFADGMVYYPGKDRILYAIDMTTGKTVWTFNYGEAIGDTSNGGRSAAALIGNDLLFGTGLGVIAVNATTGKLIWNSVTSVGKDTEVLSSPLIMGPAGKQVVVYGDLNGNMLVLSLATGAKLYSFHTHGYIVGSPADSNGNIVITSSDGFVYDFDLGGTNSTSYPSTTMSSPTDDSTIANPSSASVTASGTAKSTNCNGVLVAVEENGPAGSYWNAATSTWQAGPAWNKATLASGGCASGWSFTAPVGSPGAVLEFFARATDSDGEVDPTGITSRVIVSPASSQPHLSLSASVTPPGEGVDLTGGGYTAGEKVQISLPGAVLATATASSSGSLPSTRLTIPKGYLVGLSGVTATGETSGKSAVAALDVAMSWDQAGDSPGRMAYQANDNFLGQEETPGKQYRMEPTVEYNTGAPVDSSPAVSNLVAYIGNTAGDVDAISTVTGARLWQATTGGAVDSSPAVDTAGSGLVIAGSNDGNVYGFNLKTGATVWKTATGGAVGSSPDLLNGVVYIGSNSGKLYALNPATGAVEWSATMSGDVGSPSADPVKNEVVASDSTGDVEAFTITGSSPGTLLWTYKEGSAAGTPVVSGSTVYVGSADGNETALNETTGAKLWSTSVGGTPSSAALLGDLFVGSSDKAIYALNPSTGAVEWKDAGSGPSSGASGPVTGISVTGGILFEESSDGGVGAWRTSAENVWVAKTGAGTSSGTPAIVDNAVIFGAGDGDLYVYTPFALPMT
jgi:outer membrane protein assembly factor BamB